MANFSNAQQANLINFYRINDDRICSGAIPLSPQIAEQMALLRGLAQSEKAFVQQPTIEKLEKGGYFRLNTIVLPKNKTLELKNDLILWCQGDVVLDGDILGKMIKNSNRNGQNLLIGSEGTIIIRGSIRFVNPWDGRIWRPNYFGNHRSS